MATAENFVITIMNECHGEIRATKLEYKDGSTWRREALFGLDGHQKIEEKHGIRFSPQNLSGVGDEQTQLRVTYQHHAGGVVWGPDLVETTDPFVAHDNGRKTIFLTR